MSSLTAHEIVALWLREHGYDGLYSETDADCACEIRDLMTCVAWRALNCRAGVKAPCTCGGEHEWDIVAKKEV